MHSISGLRLALFVLGAIGSAPALAVATVTFTSATTSLPGVDLSSAAWGDYDGDGLLDILLVGDDGTQFISRVYHNDGGGLFHDINAAGGLPGVRSGDVAWGDYDNDGDLDFLIAGDKYPGLVTEIYRNDGNGEFVDIDAGLPGVGSFASVEWGDFDNDGDLDILLTGTGDTAVIARIYRNDAGAFSFLYATLQGTYNGRTACADFDNDGDLDVALTGYDVGDEYITWIYGNEGGGNCVIRATLPGVTSGPPAWGDYDNDGLLDLLVSGTLNGGGRATTVYRNDPAGTFTPVAGTNLPGGANSVSWGDYDNDGKLDVVLTGYTGTSHFTSVYKGDGVGGFSETASLSAVTWGTVEWGDYDNDGDLDIVGTGGISPFTNTYVANVYESTGANANTPPGTASGLAVAVSGNQATLRWNTSTDAETPQPALSYNVRVGTQPGGSEIASSMARVSDGLRLLPNLGNAQLANAQLGPSQSSWALDLPVPLAARYYWSVQAVDGAYAGSAFAPEQSFAFSYDITASAGANGSISPSGVVTVSHGGSQSFLLTPNPCYRVVDVLVDNVSVGRVPIYTFTNVVSNHTIAVVFGRAHAVTPERLEAWWTFDDLGAGTVRDLAHYNSGVNSGMLVGGAALVPGKIGNALFCPSIGAGMKVPVSGNSIFIGSRGFAVDAWIYLSPGSPSSDHRVIASTGGFVFFVRDRQLWVRINGTHFNAITAPISENNWHHVAVTLYPYLSHGWFYLDGDQIGSEFYPGSTDAGADLNIGRGADAFNGMIDEVDVFRASLNGPATDRGVIADIYNAGCFGKRREFVRLPLHPGSCVSSPGYFCAVFSNLSRTAQTYDWDVNAIVTQGCSGNISFTPPSGSVTVAAGGITRVPIGIIGNSGCFRVIATSHGTDDSFFTEGFMTPWNFFCEKSPAACLVPEAPTPAQGRNNSFWTGAGGAAQSEVFISRFVLFNEGEAVLTIPTRIVGVNGDTGEPTEAISLNGLDWGAAVDQTVAIAAGDSVELSVSVNVDTMNPFLADQILLSVDPDGDTVFEPLASSLVEAFEDSTGSTVAGFEDLLDSYATSTRVSVSPNPFRGWTSVSFTLAESRDVQVAVFDVAGRRLRSLHAGNLVAGPHEFMWDGRHAGGAEAKAGVYFIRVESNGLKLATKALQLR